MLESIICKTLIWNAIMIFYTGTYTQNGAPAANPQGRGIGCFKFDVQNGNIELVEYTSQRNPSYLVISDDKKYLYALEEMFENLQPEIYAYQIADDGKLILLNSQKLIGDYSCHLEIIQERVVVANYVSGNAVSYPIVKDGALAEAEQVIQHKGTGPNQERQEAAHVHMIQPFGKNQMYAVDLTLDKAKAYHIKDDTEEWIAQEDLDIQIEAGAGARHMAMDRSENFAYLLSELSGEIFVVEMQEREVIQKISFIPDSYKGEFGGAAIRLHPQGNFLYASCRGADSIAIFKIDKETNQLELVKIQSSEGKTPRDFNIDPTGEWLIAANQDSNTLVVFKIHPEMGILEKT